MGVERVHRERLRRRHTYREQQRVLVARVGIQGWALEKTRGWALRHRT